MKVLRNGQRNNDNKHNASMFRCVMGAKVPNKGHRSPYDEYNHVRIELLALSINMSIKSDSENFF